MKRFNLNRTSEHGIAVAEVLVDVVIFVILTIAIVDLSSLGTRTSLDSEHRTVALGVINERVEKIRALPYEDVGYSDIATAPNGVIPHTEEIQRSDQTYTLETTFTLVDDPLNGAATQLTEATADYKKVQVRMKWQTASDVTREVQTITYAAPSGILLTPTPCVDPSPFPTPNGSSPAPSPCPTPTIPVNSPTPTPCVPFFRCS